METPLLELRSVGMSFGAITALSNLNLSIAPGEILGLMGDNGAGKTTALKIISGYFPPSQGQLLLNSQPAHFTSPHDARDSGIETVYQDLALCDNLTAAENVFLGRELTKRIAGLRVVDRRAMQSAAQRLFDELQSDTRADLKVRRMSGGQRQAVAIARAIQSQAKLVLLDEPTAAISVRQVAQVLNVIQRLKAQGVAVILISHRMPDIFEVCERVVVLRRGEKVSDKPISSTSPEELTGLITGAIEQAWHHAA